MLVSKLLLVIAYLIGAIVFKLPAVDTLPMINGYDIDGTLVSNIGMVYNFASVVWPVRDVLLGAAFLWGFHGLMLLVRLIIGHRAPQIQ